MGELFMPISPGRFKDEPDYRYDENPAFHTEAGMAGLSKDTPYPTEIKLHQKSNELEVSFSDGNVFRLACEFLRVYSPSAEVRGHGPGQEVLQVGKQGIGINAVDPIGNYAVKFVFSDGHETGIYSWDYLYDLGVRHDEMWQAYLDRLAAAGATREPGAAPFPDRPKSK